MHSSLSLESKKKELQKSQFLQLIKAQPDRPLFGGRLL